VRCLGWHDLEYPFELLCSGVVATLAKLDVPHTQETQAAVCSIAYIATPLTPTSSEWAAPLAPATIDMEVDYPMSMPTQILPSSPLRVSIHILQANAEDSRRHHVDIRRTAGGYWSFQAFYTAFRKEFSSQIGMPDENALSAFSPMQTKREVNVTAAADGWGRSAPPVGFAKPATQSSSRAGLLDGLTSLAGAHARHTWPRQ